MIEYVVLVTFYNIDRKHYWSQYFITKKIPDKKWLHSLYDGVNDPEKMKVVGKLTRLPAKKARKR